MVKTKALELIKKKYSKSVYDWFKIAIEQGIDKSWEDHDFTERVINDAKQDGLDINDLMDLVQYIEGSKKEDSNDEPFDIFSQNSQEISDWAIDTAKEIGLEDALPKKNVIIVYLRANKVLKTSDKEKAKNAQTSGYDGLYYTGDDLVDNEPEWVVFDPKNIKSTIGNNGNFNKTSNIIESN